MGTRKRMARRFQVEGLEGRLAPGGRGGLGGEVLQIYVAPRQAHVAPPGGGAVARPEAAPVATGSKPGGTGDGLCGSNTIRAGQEDNAVAAGTVSPFQKVREA